MLLKLIKMLKLIPVFLAVAALTGCASSTEKKAADTADVHLQLGSRYLSLNKLDIAKAHLQQALDKDPRNAQAHNALAYLFEKINNYPEAGAHYEAALDLAPDDLGIQNNLGRFYCEHNEFEKGMALLLQASSTPLNDRQWQALTNAGRCQLAMKQQQKAEAYFRQALQLNDSFAPALQEMQKISYLKGNFWPAKGFLQRYLSVAAHTPQTLWIAVQTERALGNQKEAENYKKQLLETFPLSDEAKLIKSALP